MTLKSLLKPKAVPQKAMLSAYSGLLKIES